jgi:hypothetical protein
LDGHHYDENNLSQTFRRKAHLLGLPIFPQRAETDLWLFLARYGSYPGSPVQGALRSQLYLGLNVEADGNPQESGAPVGPTTSLDLNK